MLSPAPRTTPPRCTLLGLLRHGPTDWNREHRLQGRRDLPLATDALARLQRRRLPAIPRFSEVLCSPLRRARDTASALGLNFSIEPVLVEMDWGDYEGRRVSDLRAELGAEFAANEDRGLDMMPPGGESPRHVQQRLLPLLARLDRPTLAVTHKGVIRAALALAHDWPMLGRSPVRLDWEALQVMLLVDGRLRPWCYNLPLAWRPDPGRRVETERDGVEL